MNATGAAAPSRFRLTAPFRPLSTVEDYSASYAQLQHWITAGDCYQANLAIAFRTRFSGNPLDAYLTLRQVSHSPFSAYLSCDDAQILSLSPERFLAVKDGQVLTQPIKGTRRRSNNPQQDDTIAKELLSSAKDRAENLMIVDLLRNDLGRVCITGSVQTPTLFALHSFSHVHHLVSTVTGRLPTTTSPLKLMEQAFPGGSITGAPKIRAMQIISELEPVPRSIYCGSILYLDFNNHLDSNICIRTLLCADNQIFCWGGGGIVADSDCSREYQECHDKVTALMQALT
jgi:para-aminobenzoate synthetase component 1